MFFDPSVQLLGLALFFIVGVVIPFWLILPKFGLSKWISLVCLVPYCVFILLWIVALRDPNTEEKAA